jgi:hypothetical protein
MPHHFLQSYFSNRPDLWSQRVVGPAGACAQFWNEMAGTAYVRNHPFLPHSAWATTIPLGFHGDGGAFSKQDSLYSLAWNSLVTNGPTIQDRFLFSVVRKTECVADTMDALLKIFSWSMNVALSGQTPLIDHNNRPMAGGSPLCGDYRAALVQVRGDWEWYCKIFHFGQWNENVEMCPFCRASSTVPDRLWTNFEDDAGWRDTRWSHETYMAHLRHGGLPVPMMFRQVGGVIGLRLECVMVDVLHTVDQGVASHVVGNIIWFLLCCELVWEGARMPSASSAAMTT